MAQEVFTAPTTVEGKTLRQLGESGQLQNVRTDILSSALGINENTPITAGRNYTYGNVDQGSAEYQGLLRLFGPGMSPEQAAVQPAIQSQQAAIPEIQSAYGAERGRLEAEKNPLIARYDSLLSQITATSNKQIGNVNMETSREFGRRGISSQSGLFDQTLNSRVNPILEQQGINTMQTGLARESDLREIDNQISRQTGMEVADIRAVRNAIAGLQAGAGQSAIENQYRDRQLAQDQSQFQAGQGLRERELALQEQGSADPYRLLGEGGILFDTRTGRPVYENQKDYKTASTAGGGDWSIAGFSG